MYNVKNKRRTMKQKIEQMYIQALIDDLAPNVFADQVLRLFSVVGQSEQLVCKCGLPKDKKGGNFNCMRTDCDMPIAN